MTESEALDHLQAGTPLQQREAVVKLGVQPDPETLLKNLDLLTPFATDQYQDVRWSVAKILLSASQHDPSAVIPYVETVCSLLQETDITILTLAVSAAANIATEAPHSMTPCTDRLFELISDGPLMDRFGDVRGGAITTIGAIGRVDPDIAVQADIPFADRLEDVERYVRAVTILNVTKLGMTHPETIPTALARLPGRLEDVNERIRKRTIEAYIQFCLYQPTAIRDPETVAPKLRRAISRTELSDDTAQRAVRCARQIESIAECEYR